MGKKRAVVGNDLQKLYEAVEALDDAVADVTSIAHTLIRTAKEIPDPDEDNRSFLDRTWSFELNVRDWQLYSTHKGVQEVAALLTQQLEFWYKKGLPPKDLRDKMYEIMNEYIEFGARDTEPEQALVDAINILFKQNSLTRWN